MCLLAHPFHSGTGPTMPTRNSTLGEKYFRSAVLRLCMCVVSGGFYKGRITTADVQSAVGVSGGAGGAGIHSPQPCRAQSCGR
jgi:hypothetical protein